MRLTPRSSQDRIDGLQTLTDGAVVLAARVRAVPEGGRANEALLRLLAKALDARVSDCALVSGGKSRLKSIAVKGDAEELSRKLETLRAAAKE